MFVAGAAVQWLRDGLGLIGTAAETEPLARSVPDTGGVYLVPAFVGLGAPYWDMYARGALVGLTRGTTRAHVARATLEAIAYQTRDVLDAMTAEAGRAPAELRVDGGATENDFLCQFQADVLGLPILRPRVRETTALGRGLPGGARDRPLARPGGAPGSLAARSAPSSRPCRPRGGRRSTPAGAGPWPGPGTGPARRPEPPSRRQRDSLRRAGMLGCCVARPIAKEVAPCAMSSSC